jgi:hypothetical protein
MTKDNTSKMYEELRSIIDGGSESFTHADAVQYLKDNLTPQEHAEQMARLGWQYFECPSCGSAGARAFPKPEQWTPEDTAYRPGGLAQAEQEPVAWMCQEYRAAFMGDLQWFDEVEFVQPPNDPERFRNITPLYAAPFQREWVGLTDEEVDQFHNWKDCTWSTTELVRYVEFKLREKNA